MPVRRPDKKRRESGLSGMFPRDDGMPLVAHRWEETRPLREVPRKSRLSRKIPEFNRGIKWRAAAGRSRHGPLRHNPKVRRRLGPHSRRHVNRWPAFPPAVGRKHRSRVTLPKVFLPGGRAPTGNINRALRRHLPLPDGRPHTGGWKRSRFPSPGRQMRDMRDPQEGEMSLGRCRNGPMRRSGIL